MSESDLALDYGDLWYIKTRGEDDKRPQEKWGGYGQEFADAANVYDHEDVDTSPHGTWAVAGVQDTERVTLSLLVFDLDVHKADGDLDPDEITVPSDTPVVRTQNGGFHVYFLVHGERGDGSESDFTVAQDISWDVDIKGSYVGGHVVAPNDIPGVEGSYELVNDASISAVFDPADAAERIQYGGEPLVEYDPAGSGASFEFSRAADPPGEMPTCYHAGLEVRKAAPEDNPDYNPHKVNTLTALCGLAAGYDVETMVDHFIEGWPPGGEATDADREKTEYHIEHMARKIERGDLAPPSVTTLREYGILDDGETCSCDIEYHGSDDGDHLSAETVWKWWKDKRLAGEFGPDSVIPNLALKHIAETRGFYEFDALPEDVDELPPKAHNKALGWVKNEWPEQAGLDLQDDEDVTARRYKAVDTEAVWTWEDVRYIYEKRGRDEGRYAAVRLLRERYHFVTPADTEALHVYDDEQGIYREDRRFDLVRELEQNLGRFYKKNEKNEVLDRLKSRVRDRDELDAKDRAEDLICVANGVLDLQEAAAGAGEDALREHSPEYGFTKRLPVEYDPSADCPAIEQFLDDITRRDPDKKALLEVLGNALLPDYRHHKVLILFGEGSNGKSVWLNVVREFLGDDNTASLSLQKLAENRFATARLVGKWANIAEDLPSKKLQDTGTLKDLSGGGEVPAERKGVDGFDFENRAQLMFAANRPPVLGERSYAIQRRLVPIHLPHKFTDQDDEHKDARNRQELMEELTADEELSGLLNAAIAGLARLEEQGDVSLPESHEQRLELYERHSDHIKAFRLDCLTNTDGDRVDKSAVYSAYTNYCNEKGHEPVGRDTFWRNLRQTTLDVSVVRPAANANGERPRLLDNAAFTDAGTEFAPARAVDVDDDPEGDAISEVAVGDRHVTLEGRITERAPDQPDAIAEKATLVDDTDEIEVTVWADANKPKLEPGTCYRLKDVKITEYEGRLQAEVSQRSGVEQIAAGVGHAPPAPAGDNERLETAADGAGDLDQLKPKLRQIISEEYETGDEIPPAELVDRVDYPRDEIESALDGIQRGSRLLVGGDGEGYTKLGS